MHEYSIFLMYLNSTKKKKDAILNWNIYQTSDLIENTPFKIDSGAIHLTGNRFVHFNLYVLSESKFLAKPKSAILTTSLVEEFVPFKEDNKQFLAAKSLWTILFYSKYSQASALCIAIIIISLISHLFFIFK